MARYLQLLASKTLQCGREGVLSAVPNMRSCDSGLVTPRYGRWLQLDVVIEKKSPCTRGRLVTGAVNSLKMECAFPGKGHVRDEEFHKLKRELSTVTQ